MSWNSDAPELNWLWMKMPLSSLLAMRPPDTPID